MLNSLKKWSPMPKSMNLDASCDRSPDIIISNCANVTHSPLPSSPLSRIDENLPNARISAMAFPEENLACEHAPFTPQLDFLRYPGRNRAKPFVPLSQSITVIGHIVKR
jgi:hypothetical protein